AFTAAGGLLRHRPDFVFCCNDRLAEGLLHRCRRDRVTPPAVVGFDNAPVAEQLGLTTVGIPWREFVSASAEVIVRRLAGDRSVARRQIFTPLPVLRSSHRPGGPRSQ
ncbi:MAG: substrate-binding domain-containing protein, partial [Planctomycetota bacterium]